MNEGEATDLQIKQDWIQCKGMHPLYHDQVVYGNVDDGVAPANPQKWPTQLTLTDTLICTKPPNSFMCLHFKTPKGFLLRV